MTLSRLDAWLLALGEDAVIRMQAGNCPTCHRRLRPVGEEGDDWYRCVICAIDMQLWRGAGRSQLHAVSSHEARRVRPSPGQPYYAQPGEGMAWRAMVDLPGL